MTPKTSSLLLVLALLLTVTIPGWTQSAHIAKKVISFSGNPTARMFHDDVREMERLMPVVDGVYDLSDHRQERPAH